MTKPETIDITLLFVFQSGSDFAAISLLSINIYQTILEVYKLQLVNKSQKHTKV